MHTIQTLDLNDTRTIIDAGIAEAERIGNPMNIAVVEAGGCLLAFARMDDAWRGSVDIAISKAWTARAFDVETKALAKLAQPGADFYGIHASNDGKVMIFAGGVPIKKGETVIGAVGVSGGTGKQDQGVAEAAALLAATAEEGGLILAGGQTLTPMMALRVAFPSDLIDITAIPGLDRIETGAEGATRIGIADPRRRFRPPPGRPSRHPAGAPALDRRAARPAGRRRRHDRRGDRIRMPPRAVRV